MTPPDESTPYIYDATELSDFDSSDTESDSQSVADEESVRDRRGSDVASNCGSLPRSEGNSEPSQERPPQPPHPHLFSSTPRPTYQAGQTPRAQSRPVSVNPFGRLSSAPPAQRMLSMPRRAAKRPRTEKFDDDEERRSSRVWENNVRYMEALAASQEVYGNQQSRGASAATSSPKAGSATLRTPMAELSPFSFIRPGASSSSSILQPPPPRCLPPSSATQRQSSLQPLHFVPSPRTLTSHYASPPPPPPHAPPPPPHAPPQRLEEPPVSYPYAPSVRVYGSARPEVPAGGEQPQPVGPLMPMTPRARQPSAPPPPSSPPHAPIGYKQVVFKYWGQNESQIIYCEPNEQIYTVFDLKDGKIDLKDPMADLDHTNVDQVPIGFGKVKRVPPPPSHRFYSHAY